MWDGIEVLSAPANSSGGVLTRENFNRFIDRVKASNTAPSWCFAISPYTMKKLRHMERIGRVYALYPVPRRKIRKCHTRKLIERRRRYKAHIARVELAEARREVA